MLLRTLPVLVASLLFGTSGAQWQGYSTGLQVNSITTFGGNIYVASPSYGVSRSTTDGASWALANNGLPVVSGAVLVEGIGSNSTHLFAGTQSGIYRSANGGDSWSAANGSLTASNNVHARKFFHFGNTTFAVFKGAISAGGGVYRTTDNGSNWLIGHSGMSSNMVVYHLAYDGWVMYAATSTGLYRSYDLGQQWLQVPGVNYAVYSVQLTSGRIHMISINGYRYSTNDGANWTNSSGAPMSGISGGELISYNGNLYASTGMSQGVLITMNNGVSYSNFNSGLDAVNQATAGQFHASPTRLYLGTLFDLWSIPGSTVGVVESELELPKPYPSVFVDGFQVDLGTRAAGAMLLLIDDAGREVLRASNLPASLVRVDRGDLAAGRYSCVLVEPSTGSRSALGAVIAQ